ncbi:hypothetical protein C1J03_09095 [Sulfitobacter sp. SK012]|uniref:divergent polysaccharide deacetylase family protein n=1 Tax=Sulfitobacter sp. SK012 TaxID=1389005 RepID=UPI000E0AD05D|nr:divergent polysaccharide deacetylase family protein [Sulfitobacter sp. SK012]AXI46163.1 hypothetical protein C1J03_09095 [Sulfitobacter sp. SK012]
MARGVLSGMIFGAVASLGVAGAISVLVPVAPPTPAPQVPETAPEQAAASDAVPQDVPATPPQDEAVIEPRETPQALQTPTDTATSPLDVEGGLGTQAPKPQTGVVDGLGTPQSIAQSAAAQPEDDAPVLPNPQALAPMEPLQEDQLPLDTEPAAKAVPPVAEVVETPVAESDSEKTEEVPEADAVVPEAVAEVDTPVTEPVETTEVQPVEEPQADPDLDVADVPQADAPSPQAPAEEVAELQDTQTPEDQAVSGGPRIGKPATSLLARDSGIQVNRPEAEDAAAVVVAGAADAAEPALPTTVTPQAPAVDSNLPIHRYAQVFDNPEQKPLMGIVLIDHGFDLDAGGIGLPALGSFPYPLSFAVDASLPDAVARMTRYREEGFEVLAMIDLPEGAQPVDVETNLAVMLPRMAEVVGVLEGTGTGFPDQREATDQVAAVLAQTGHGLITQAQGLNTAATLARKQGVPAVAVFRDFDGKDQSAKVIRRFLDQAAFKASQEGGVIMLGRLRPETIKALLVWGLADRASQVALAPVSAVLTQN